MNTLSKRVAMVAAFAACLIGCGDDGESTKAGSASRPVTIRLGYYEGPGSEPTDHIEEFARQVGELSDGQLRIEPVWNATGGEDGRAVDDWDQVVARKIIDGELEMGLVASRAWDTEGVTTLRALNAPFLVTSDEAVARVVTSDAASELLAGLDSVGVTGLALLPDGLRHLFVFGDRPTSLDDFDGGIIRSPRSHTVYAFLAALGAKPDDLADDDAVFSEGIRNGSVVGAESSFEGALRTPQVPTAIGNATLFPKANALVINAEAFDDLTESQRNVLRDAAARTVESAVAKAIPDTEHAEVFCRNGGTIIVADDVEVAALHRAAQTVYRDLEQEEATRAIIGELRGLAEPKADPVEVTECEPAGSEEEAASPPATASSFPEGVYRMEMPAELLLDAGVDRATANGHAGTWTLTFEDGQFSDGDCDGTYRVEDDRVITAFGDGAACGTVRNQDFFSAGWTLDGDQLQFVDIQSVSGFQLLLENLFGGVPFTKIG